MLLLTVSENASGVNRKVRSFDLLISFLKYKLDLILSQLKVLSKCERVELSMIIITVV